MVRFGSPSYDVGVCSRQQGVACPGREQTTGRLRGLPFNLLQADGEILIKYLNDDFMLRKFALLFIITFMYRHAGAPFLKRANVFLQR